MNLVTRACLLSHSCSSLSVYLCGCTIHGAVYSMMLYALDRLASSHRSVLLHCSQSFSCLTRCSGRPVAPTLPTHLPVLSTRVRPPGRNLWELTTGQVVQQNWVISIFYRKALGIKVNDAPHH